MQPNFAFATTSALEIIPKPRPTEYLSSKQPSRDKCSSEPAYADASHRSFKSSLREASQSQQDGGRSRPTDDDPVAVKRADREVGPSKAEETNTQAAADDKPAENGDHTDHGCEKSPTDSSDPQLSATAENEEGVENELAGLGAVTSTAPLTETADPGLSIISNSDASSPPAVGSETQPNVTPGDMAAGGSGAGSLDQKEALLGQHTGAIEADPTTKIRIPETEMIGTEKSETMTAVKSGDGTDPAGSDASKGFDEFNKLEQNLAQTDKTNLTGRQVSENASSIKTHAPERLADPHQPLTEQGTAAQQSQTAKVPQAEDVTVARPSEASSEQQGAARVQGEFQQARENEAKLDPVANDDSTQKIAKMNPGSKDSAFMGQQEQNFDRLMESASSTREKEAPAGAFRAQTMDQIVSKAVYQLKNGQNSVRIDLKPEFLGQVRMQIVTVDQQVSIRISAELPVVKEMLENNLQQLKADLQQQGLEVDEIDVSVSTDSHPNAQSRKMKSDNMFPPESSAAGEGAPELEPVAEANARRGTTNRAVDMFA